ncbi:uncharacterized protein LOC121418435 [Lytechinus variegatus]|uniref:uncharacterized protein LOC121418435 n=1 Tax=Lytechinus variegatus TaxID=7654 RepID=UPI001BB12618|nr:uncharacterized protein LOC121418435 [Lytechinus variegatus]
MMVIKGHLGSTTSGGGPRQLKPQPIKSWTAKSEKVYEKSRENGFVPAQRGLYTKTKNPLPVKYTVRGEWELQECEEHLTWLNKVLKKKKHKPLTDFRKSVSDGLTLVNLLEILFNEKIQGIQTRPIIRAQRIENIHLCLRFLQTKGFDTRGVNAEEITDGNLRSTIALINTLRRRFESTTVSTGSQKQDSAPSTPRGPVPDSISQNEERISLQGRDPSTLSQISVQSETSFGRKSGDYTMNGTEGTSEMQTTTPRLIPNGHVEPALPGLMGSTNHEDELPVIAHNDHTVMSMTEMGSKGVLQHGAETRRTQLSKESPRGAIRPQPVKAGDSWNPLANLKSPLRDTLSMTVEEKLKNLLDSPTPGSLINGNNQPQFDDGELLELPPPNFRDVTDEDEAIDEEANLQAMLEDPDKFDYPKDWDRYISGYVPSTTTEKKEGPRAQALLDQPPTSTTPPPDASTPTTNWNRPAPFFHGPSSHHMGTAPSTQPPQEMSGYSNGRPQPIRPISKKLPDNFRNLSGVVYGEEPINKGSMSNLSQTWSAPYRTPGDGQRTRHLPSYEDHIQRHSPPVYRKLQPNGQSPPTSGYESRGRSSPKTLPRSQGFQRYYSSSRSQFPDQYNTDAGFHEQYIDQMDNRGQAFMSQSLPQPLDDQGLLQRLYQRPNQNTAFVPIRASNPMYPMMPGGGMSEEAFAMQQMAYEYDMPYSESSSRSHTPPLPPLSPDITPPETPPDSPSAYKKNRSSSIWAANNQQSPLNPRRNRGDSLGKLRKGPVNRSHSANYKLGDSRSPLKRSGSKSRRKNKHGSRTNSRASASTGKDSRKSSGSSSRVPSLQLNQVQEQTEASDSDVSPKQKASSSLMSGPDGREEETLQGNPSRASSLAGGKENQNMEAVRSQLLALEGMYKEILGVIGSSKLESDSPKAGSKISAPMRNVGKQKSNKLSTKQRERDIKTVNKRFSRVESHVVTLARSVAHLSSELRSQNALIREIEALRIEVNQLKDVAYFNHDVSSSSRNLHRPFVPQCANPQKIKKLTKFFGEEPPLLSIFLKDLGYEKYSSNFEKAGISMIEMPYLSEEKLENIGIPIGPRLRILQEAQIMV